MEDHVENVESRSEATCETNSQASERQETTIQDARLAQISAYHASVLRGQDARAIFATVNAGLITIVVQLDGMIQQALATEPQSIDRVQKMLPVLHAYLKANRQVGILAEIQQKISQPRRPPTRENDPIYELQEAWRREQRQT